MNLDQLLGIRDEISALLLDKVDGAFDSEKAAATLASKQLEQMGCMGGSTRALVEAEIVRLMRRFDDSRQSSFGPWPVSKFMDERDERANKLQKALAACVAAHKTGRYEPLVAAIEAAENTISDLTE